MKKTPEESRSRATVYTIGHSTHPLTEFIAILRAHEIRTIADIRTIPRSRHNPQFNRETLPAALEAAGIGYIHVRELGGLRHARADSVNSGWHNLSFRGYADYMQTQEFADAINMLIVRIRTERVCLMCAEAVPWRCHRFLLADALLVRNIRVEHIMNAASGDPHKLNPLAIVDDTRVIYPSETPGDLFHP